VQKAILDAFLWLALRVNGFDAQTAEVLVRMSRLETGHYTSDAFKTHRNAFGMGIVHSRPTTQVGGHPNADAGIGHYRTLWGSVRDMRMYFDYFGEPTKARGTLSKDFWKRYNPKASYPESVLGTAHQIGRGLSVLALLAPITYIVITKLIKHA
jgi:hypothetical protein